MSLEAMIGRLTREEKLAAMDLIWQDLASDSQSFVSPEWHKGLSRTGLRTPLRGMPCR